LTVFVNGMEVTGTTMIHFNFKSTFKAAGANIPLGINNICNCEPDLANLDIKSGGFLNELSTHIRIIKPGCHEEDQDWSEMAATKSD